jgi:hypothetical protein
MAYQSSIYQCKASTLPVDLSTNQNIRRSSIRIFSGYEVFFHSLLDRSTTRHLKNGDVAAKSGWQAIEIKPVDSIFNTAIQERFYI